MQGQAHAVHAGVIRKGESATRTQPRVEEIERGPEDQNAQDEAKKPQNTKSPPKKINLRKFAKPKTVNSRSPPPSPTVPESSNSPVSVTPIRRQQSLPNEFDQSEENLDSLLDKLYKYKENGWVMIGKSSISSKLSSKSFM